MIYSFDELALRFDNYTDVKGKIRREIKSGKLIPITRGLYETDANISGKYLAGSIFYEGDLYKIKINGIEEKKI